MDWPYTLVLVKTNVTIVIVFRQGTIVVPLGSFSVCQERLAVVMWTSDGWTRLED